MAKKKIVNTGGAGDKRRPKDSSGNPSPEPPAKPSTYVSPRMQKHWDAVELLTVEQLRAARDCFGFEFAKGNKATMVASTLAFLSDLEKEDALQRWLSSLPPYLAAAIRDAAFSGYASADDVERAAGVPIHKANGWYRETLNPDLRLGLFSLHESHGRRLLFLHPVFRTILSQLLPKPPGYAIQPAAEQNVSGWSAVDTLSESMPLLLKAIDRLLTDRANSQKVVRRGLTKRAMTDMRKGSDFPQFPMGAQTGVDPIELITRFVANDPDKLFDARGEDVRDLIRELVNTFLTIPKSGRVISLYFPVNSNFEFSVLCPHLSRTRGGKTYQSPFHPHPPARTAFYNLVTTMAQDELWYDIHEVAESLRLQDTPFGILRASHGASHIHLKGEHLTLPDGTVESDPWDMWFVPDAYLQHHILARPLLKGYCYLMAALGLLEIREEEPQKLLEKRGKVTPVSPFDGLTHTRITPFGAWCLGASTEKPALRAVSYEAIADRELPLVTYRGHSLECRVFLEQIGDPIGEDRFRVTEASFARDCENDKALGRRVDEFHRLISPEPAPHWEELFARVRRRAQLFNTQQSCVMIQLPDDPTLRRLFLEDKTLSSLVVRAEGGRIVVVQENYPKLRKALEAHGVLRKR